VCPALIVDKGLSLWFRHRYGLSDGPGCFEPSRRQDKSTNWTKFICTSVDLQKTFDGAGPME